MHSLACAKLFPGTGLTLGLMIPTAARPGQGSGMTIALAVARRADQHGFAALWAGQPPQPPHPPQSHQSDPGALLADDPFIWLAALGAAAPHAALIAQPDLQRHATAHLLSAARSLQAISSGRCALGVAAAGNHGAAQLRATLAAAQAASIPLVQLDATALRHPLVRTLQLDLDERASAPAQPYHRVWRGGRLALGAELERWAAAGVAHVLLQLVRNGRPLLDLIDELGSELMPRLALGVLS